MIHPGALANWLGSKLYLFSILGVLTADLTHIVLARNENQRAQFIIWFLLDVTAAGLQPIQTPIISEGKFTPAAGGSVVAIHLGTCSPEGNLTLRFPAEPPSRHQALQWIPRQHPPCLISARATGKSYNTSLRTNSKRQNSKQVPCHPFPLPHEKKPPTKR